MKESDVRARAFAMPFTSPAFPIGPYRFVNREYLIITYRTDPRKLRELVPELLQIDEPLVKFEFIRMPDSTGFGDYTESGQVIPVTFQGRKGGYSHCMFLDDHPPIAGGPELWGFPKKLAKPTLYDQIDTLVGTLDYGSMRIATGTMGYKHKVADHDAVMASFRYQFLLTGASPGGGRASPMCRMNAGHGSTNSKAAEPGRPTALRRLSNRLGRGAPTLRPPHASKRDQGPGSDQKSIGFAQSTSSGLFAAAELTGDPACLAVSARGPPELGLSAGSKPPIRSH